MNIKIRRIEDGKIPSYQTVGSAGADCYARISEKVIVKPKTIETIPLGFAVEIPEGFELQIRGRSGLARKKRIQVFNSPGTIDSDYRGEVVAILYNASNDDFEVNSGDRIAQAIVAPVIHAEWQIVEELSETGRGNKGFGSTGKSDEDFEKFYEPFQKISEVEQFLDKEVLIDNSIRAVLKEVYWSDFLRIVFRDENGKEFNLYSTQAFERVKIDGHRFGKEI